MILGYLKLLRFSLEETCVKSSNSKNSLFKFFHFSHHCLIFFFCCSYFFHTFLSVPDGFSKDPLTPEAGSSTSPKWMLQKTAQEQGTYTDCLENPSNFLQSALKGHPEMEFYSRPVFLIATSGSILYGIHLIFSEPIYTDSLHCILCQCTSQFNYALFEKEFPFCLFIRMPNNFIRRP